jgi:hypothetical protein
LIASISSQSQKARGSFALFEAASALSEIALKDRPGGSIRPFCEPADRDVDAPFVVPVVDGAERRDRVHEEERRVAALSIAASRPRSPDVTPVEVSLCTIQTALMAWPLSSASRASIAPASTPERQSPWMNSASMPSFFCHPAPQRREPAGLEHQHAVAGAESVLTSARLPAPVPDAG